MTVENYFAIAIAVIAVAPTGKASFVYSYAQTRLMGQYNGKWPLSLVYVLKPLITVIGASMFLVRVFRNTLIPSVKMTLKMNKMFEKKRDHKSEEQGPTLKVLTTTSK